MAVSKKVVKKASNRSEPPQPPKPPVKINTTPKALSAKDAQANAKAIAKFNRGEARTASRVERQLAPGRARAERANAGRPQPPQPRGGSGAPPGATNANRVSGAYSDKVMSVKQYLDSLYKQTPKLPSSSKGGAGPSRGSGGNMGGRGNMGGGLRKQGK